MEAISWLAAANAAIWLGIGGYVAFLARKQCELRRRMHNLELILNEKNDESQ